MTGKIFIQHRDKVVQRHVAQCAIDLACEAYNITAGQVLRPGRSTAKISRARQVAMYLAHVVGQLSMVQVSEEFSRDRSTVAHGLHMIEDRRDSPMFDQQISFLEGEFERQLMDLYRNWLSVSNYYHARLNRQDTG